MFGMKLNSVPKPDRTASAPGVTAKNNLKCGVSLIRDNFRQLENIGSFHNPRNSWSHSESISAKKYIFNIQITLRIMVVTMVYTIVRTHQNLLYPNNSLFSV
jgi:hypothetical protein